ncbi:hypothetical protein L6E12_08220 [Actinokineospora sp. PR83]|uniref:hypothetical protein n=1 Tax=Actinokineospora sp. PR83 TaxID=2884908 RepID=UPI001F1F990C|nr:hypothetical protein [Actinokineospora sp. PR83]MCG8915772.1 hypothetical protein [Actinokineospora sp. PR83]
MTGEHDLLTFAGNPVEYFSGSRLAMHTLPRGELERLQLEAARLRFAALRDRVPVLTTMAEEQGITELGGLDDAAPLLFPHTVYKSYPASLLTDNRFDRLTRWLARLTTVDLSEVDARGLGSIDAWLDLVDERTPLRLAHSSGTTGTMSFLPHTAVQYDRLYEMVRLDVNPDADVDVVWPSFRTGRSGIARHATAMGKQLGGSPDRFHTLHDGHLSADVMHLAGRLRAAAARGELDRVRVPANLAERRAEFEDALDATGRGMGEFVQRLADTLGGRRIASLSTWDVFHGMAEAGAGRGLRGVFSPDSVLLPGGGSKAGALPEDWDRGVMAFAGVDRLAYVYAMVEVIALNMLCQDNAYHVEPWLVLYLLDPDTGRVLPRRGTVTGRAAFLDLSADLFWGGFVSGDKVTVTWEPCPCGRTTPRLHHGTVGRFGGAGGDDKITCAATASALTETLEFLNGALV